MEENVCAYKIIWKINAVLSIFFSYLSQGPFSSQFLQALGETAMSLSTAKGAEQKGQAAFIPALFHLEKCLSGMK